MNSAIITGIISDRELSSISATGLSEIIFSLEGKTMVRYSRTDGKNTKWNALVKAYFSIIFVTLIFSELINIETNCICSCQQSSLIQYCQLSLKNYEPKKNCYTHQFVEQ